MFALDDEHSVLTCLDMGGAYLMVEPGGPPPVARKDIDQNPVTLRFNVADIDAAAESLGEKGFKGVLQRFPCFPSCRVATRTKRHT